ncbi:hypothetical protein GCM10010389_64670 [Streptomyces echinoruber]|uniref:Uncharacterized protein n=1 Tax=Streptomyces echinoruber TaxID=68898 RepID=A0A918RYJ6_9ACTN|nr:hypothetical protein GCM10010389_64670 [Streptomyces echinoruber]
MWWRPRGAGAAPAGAAMPWDALRQSWAHDDGRGARVASEVACETGPEAACETGPEAASEAASEAVPESAADRRRPHALLRRAAIPLCALAVPAVPAVLGHWWAGGVTLVWTTLVVRGVRAVRSAAAGERAAALESAPSPAVPPPGRDQDPVSPGRAFAEGIAQVLVFPALFSSSGALPATEPGDRTGPDGPVPEPSREHSRRCVAEALLRAHAELGLPVPGEPGAPDRNRDKNRDRGTGGTP